jgi:hypothetical protein
MYSRARSKAAWTHSEKLSGLPMTSRHLLGDVSLRVSNANGSPANVCLWHIASFRCAAEFDRYRGIADSGKPSARQIFRFTAWGIVALPDRRRPPRHKADSERFGYPFGLQYW